MGTAIATRRDAAPAPAIADVEERNALVRRLFFRNANPEQLQYVFGVCERYGFDPLLKHVALIAGSLYVTRDGLLHVAHASGRFDGIEEVSATQDQDGQWEVTVAVWRKDMRRPFRYTALQRECRNPSSDAWKQSPRAMTLKTAEVMALRRAFDVSLGGAEELGYDVAARTANRGAVELAEVAAPRPAPPAGPPPSPEQCLAFIADPSKAPDRKRKAARLLFPQAPDLPTLEGYRAGVAPHLHEDDWYPDWHDRFTALGGRDTAPADQGADQFAGDDSTFPIDAEFAEAGAGEEPA